MAFDASKLLKAEMLQAIGFTLVFASQAAIVGETIAGFIPSWAAGFGALAVVAGSVMKILGMNQ